MFGIGGSVRLYYCSTPINLRKSFDGLAGAVEEYIKQDPESGHVFAFFSRNKKQNFSRPQRSSQKFRIHCTQPFSRECRIRYFNGEIKKRRLNARLNTN